MPEETRIDHVTGAVRFRQELEKIAKARDIGEAKRIARAALNFVLETPSEATISIEPGVTAKSLEPYLTISMTNPAMQVSVERAREIAIMFSEMAEQAMSEAFLMSFLVVDVEVSLERAAMALNAYRKFKQGKRHRTSAA